MKRAVCGVLLAASTLLAGCASVQVIAPVAEQNRRNAEALNSNARTLVAVDDALFKAAMASHLNQAYTEVIAAVQADAPSGAPAAYYQQQADLLRQATDRMDPAARALQIQTNHRTHPLPAAVAYAQMPAATAAQKWDTFRALRQAPTQDQPQLNRMLFRDLTAIGAAEQTAADLAKAHAELAAAVLAQANNSVVIARQLATASAASGDAGAFLKGVAEDPRTLTGIAEYIAGTSDSAERRQAAEELLKKLAAGAKK